MNLPNKLTLFRVVLVPVFAAVLLLHPESTGWRIAAVAIYIVACLTDMLDGMIARKYNLITDFGKFMDPLADKLLVCTALICLLSTGQLPAWAVIIIIAREFIISGFRLVAADNGVVIAASWWGKSKTIVQMLMTIVLIANFPHPLWQLLGRILLIAAVVLTVISLVDYLYKNRAVLQSQK